MHRNTLVARLPRTTQEWILFLRRALQTPIADVHYPEHFYLRQIKKGPAFTYSPQKSPMPLNATRESAVLVLLSPTDTGTGFLDMCVTLTKRTDKVGSHKNQMSFPGGRVDEGEEAQAAASREAFEETGLIPSTYEVVGPLTCISTNRDGSRLSPFVAVSTAPAHPFCASPDEVDSVHYLHLSSLLLDAANTHSRVIKYHSFSSKFPSYFPCFFTSTSQEQVCAPVHASPHAPRLAEDNGFEPMLSDDFPGELVWGLTSFVTCELVARVANAMVDATADRAARNAAVEELLSPSNTVARDPLETPSAAAASASQGSD